MTKNKDKIAVSFLNGVLPPDPSAHIDRVFRIDDKAIQYYKELGVYDKFKYFNSLEEAKTYALGLFMNEAINKFNTLIESEGDLFK